MHNCQETETHIVQACHTPWQPLQMYKWGVLWGWMTPWSAEKMLDGQHQRLEYHNHSQWPSKETGRRALLNRLSCPLDGPVGQGTELNWHIKKWTHLTKQQGLLKTLQDLLRTMDGLPISLFFFRLQYHFVHNRFFCRSLSFLWGCYFTPTPTPPPVPFCPQQVFLQVSFISVRMLFHTPTPTPPPPLLTLSTKTARK